MHYSGCLGKLVIQYFTLRKESMSCAILYLHRRERKGALFERTDDGGSSKVPLLRSG